MATKHSKKRINITADPEMQTVLERIAKRDGLQVTTIATLLLRRGLELEEDIILSSLAERRDTSSSKYISHESAWK